MSRAAVACIDVPALHHNLDRVRRAAPAGRILAAVKADAYGHGLLRVARALVEADGFAVACLEEAVVLRENGIEQPILLLEGVFEAAELMDCSRLGLDIAVHQSEQVAMLEQAWLQRPLRVWLKIDTGMHRLGVAPAAVTGLWERLHACPAVAPPLRLMSHLARADERDSDCTLQQCRVFDETTRTLPGERSLANSAGILIWPQTHRDWVRPGLMLYGASPFPDTVAAEEGLLPVMTLSTRLIAIRRLARGEPVGYGGAFRCPEDMDVGIAAIGYGDGYPRHAPTGTPVLVNGRRAGLAGRVSMDLIAIDLRRHPEARVGDPVVLWGRGLPIELIARCADTIPYTLTCGVTARVRFTA